MLMNAPAGKWAAFLDVDGTLLDIAPSPDAVSVPADLVTDLMRLRDTLDGALAFVTGRKLADIERFFPSLNAIVAAEHGAIIRLPDGRFEEAHVDVPAAWRESLARLAAEHPGVLIEEKKHSIVAHFRLAPDAEPVVRRTVDSLVAGAADQFHIMPAKMAFELCSRNVSKGAAVRRLLDIAPFTGRQPVYIGDDVTDEPAIAAAREAGGLGLHVVHDFGGEPAKVRAWIKALADGAAASLASDARNHG